MITRLTAASNAREIQANKNNNRKQFDSLSPTNHCESEWSSLNTTCSSESSLRSSPQATSSMTRSSSNVNASSSAAAATAAQKTTRSPILIKYNYYDYNGSRQEQPNQDMRHQQHQQSHNSPAASGIQRQLSPTFRQNLDQILVRSSSHSTSRLTSVVASNKNGSTSSSVSSPSPVSPTGGNAIWSSSSSAETPSPEHPGGVMHFARRYQLSSYEQRCLRCNTTVYQMDKVGPLKEFTFYHQNCFKCRECGTKLTLRTYFNNQQSSRDLEVYCHRHCPKTGPGKLDNQSVGIRAALNAPKVFDPSLTAGGQFRDEAGMPAPANCNSAPNYNSNTINARLHLHHEQQQQQPQVDSRALHIQHAVQQTKLQNIYKQSQVDKKISQFLERRLEYLEPKQKLLEMRHREEEDALFKAFELKWRQEEKSISEQIRDEWQLELNKLLDKYKRQLSSIQLVGSDSSHHNSTAASHHHQHHHHPHQQQQQQQQQQLAAELASNFNKAAAELPRQIQLQRNMLPVEQNNNNNNGKQMIEYERLNLEKTMTIKLDRKKETLKRKLKEFERQATAELVEKQSREMLALISMKLDEYKEEQKRKIGSDLEHFEAIEKLANRLAGSSLSSPPPLANGAGHLDDQEEAELRNSRRQQATAPKPTSKVAKARATGQNFESPPPEAPKVSKMELYNYEEPDEVFRDIDQLAINVAKGDQRTFTDLVHHLTRNCLTDVEKVRAIFRWITVKNLNTMQFDSTVKADTPLGLLRGIKNGSESYHVLFKRLCSYAGLHCVVIKGYSKSAGYQPGIKFEGNRFRNSWNAVYVAGAWRFVQCNWGARHLVSVAIMQDKNNQASNNGNIAANDSSSAAAATATAAAPRLTSKQLAANAGRSHQHSRSTSGNGAAMLLQSPNHGRRGLISAAANNSSSSSSASSSVSSLSSASATNHHLRQAAGGIRSPAGPLSSPGGGGGGGAKTNNATTPAPNDSLRYEYDDHYFLTDPDEFIYEFFPVSAEWQLLKSRPVGLAEFEQLPFVRSLFFKYGLYFPQHDIRSVLLADSSGATTIKIGMPTHMVPSLIFHYNLKYYDSDLEHHDGVSLKRFVMQSVESGDPSDSGGQLSNVVSFRVHLPENGAYILDIFANSTTPNQYITGEPMKFKSVCKFKIVAKNLKTVMIPLPDCASGEYGPMKATRLFGIIPITHESALISVQNDKRFLEIQFRMTRPLVDFMASLHKNGYDEKQLSKAIKIFVDGDIVFVTVKFFEDGQYGLDIYTRDQSVLTAQQSAITPAASEPKKQLLTHCCKYLINVRTASSLSIQASR